jgi:hypothetical protein
VTALSVMAFLAAGHTPGQGKYGETVRKAIDFIVSKAPENGYWGKVDGSRMYGQGIITLALSEAAGVEPDPQRRKKLRETVDRSIKLIMKAQQVPKEPKFAGGWRYEPNSRDADLSLSGWSALALRASQNIGLAVPKEAVDEAVKFVKHCNVKGKGFSYRPGGDNLNASMTGVGVLNLYLLDSAENPMLPEAAEYLQKNLVNTKTGHMYYAFYYVTQASFQAGGETWETVWKNTHEQLLKLQREDGGWPDHSGEPGRVYATAMSVLSLSVPYRLLPIYQR